MRTTYNRITMHVNIYTNYANILIFDKIKISCFCKQCSHFFWNGVDQILLSLFFLLLYKYGNNTINMQKESKSLFTFSYEIKNLKFAIQNNKMWQGPVIYFAGCIIHVIFDLDFYNEIHVQTHASTESKIHLIWFDLAFLIFNVPN